MNRALVIALVLLAVAGPVAAAPVAAPFAASPTDHTSSLPAQCFGPPCDQTNAVCYILFGAYCLG